MQMLPDVRSTVHRNMLSNRILFVFCLLGTFSRSSAELFEDLKGKAFVSIWNAPSKMCETKFGIRFDLSRFDIVANTNDAFIGDEMVIFYRDQLGLYPYLRPDGTPVNGGIPQNGDLTRHLQKVADDINRVIPNTSFSGLAVIDWEGWRPIFVRNRYNSEMKKYVWESENLVRNKHPDWSDDRVKAEAMAEFESAARKFMQTTLELCRRLRPRGYWGFYGFPNCYNHKAGEKSCANDTVLMNDRLSWLFASSTVLLPSIYLSTSIGPAADRYWFVNGQLKEAIRLANDYGRSDTPIVPYTRFRYRDTDLYSKTDLAATIQQSAEAGLNGVALWDSSALFESFGSCKAASTYVNTTLGPFVENQTVFMNSCSRTLCTGHGRCVKRDWNVRQGSHSAGRSLSERLIDFLTYLIREWLFRSFQDGIIDRSRIYKWKTTLHTSYKCNCYQGWTGENCQIADRAMSS